MGARRPVLQNYRAHPETASEVPARRNLFPNERIICRFRSWNYRSPTRIVETFTAQRRLRRPKSQTEVRIMLSWVVTFLVIALIAGILGFGGLAGASIEIAKIIFFIAIVLFLVSAVVSVARGRTRV
jgi:uncharacterized membrane protein YtjA (UPF0391 family)